MSARRNIALIGFMGTGKSTIGRLVATRLGYRFIDTDRLVVEQAGMEIPEIFRQFGEEHFRGLETAALASLRDATEVVIATGGGIILRPDNVAALREMAFVCWLNASQEVILERVSRNRKRPLLQTTDPERTIAELLAARIPLYEEAGMLSVDTTTMTHMEAAEAIIVAAHP